MQSEFVTVSGRDFHVLTAGDRSSPALLFLHGFPEFSGAWSGMLERLSDAFFCIAPDQRGYGQSWRPAEVEAYEVQHLVKDAAGLIAHYGGQVQAVVAHDWGAAVGYALAMRHPDLMQRLVVLNGVHPAPFQAALASGGAQSVASGYIDWLRRPGSEQMLAANGFEKLLTLFGASMDLSWLTPELRVRYEAAWRDAEGLRGMINWYRASHLKLAQPGVPLDPKDVPKMDPQRLRITMPHLLIWGMDDSALLPESRKDLEQFCDALNVENVAGADHWIIHQKPDLVAGLIRDFCSG